jgi:hypothetical protein
MLDKNNERKKEKKTIDNDDITCTFGYILLKQKNHTNNHSKVRLAIFVRRIRFGYKI